VTGSNGPAQREIMSQHVIVVTYVYWRRRPDPVREKEWLYQAWILTETRLAGLEEVDAESVLQATRATDDAERLCEWLREASVETAADYIEGVIWRVWQTSDHLSLVQAIDFFAKMSDSLHDAVQGSLENLANDAAVPAPVSLVGADVFATLLTKPITEPLTELGHGLELVGIFVGLATGLHPLVMSCAKYLIHDEIGNVLSQAIDRMLSMLINPEEGTSAEARTTVTAVSLSGLSSASVSQEGTASLSPRSTALLRKANELVQPSINRNNGIQQLCDTRNDDDLSTASSDIRHHESAVDPLSGMS